MASHCNPSHRKTVLRGNKATTKPASRRILRVFLCPSFYLDYGAGPFFKRTCKGLVLEEGKGGERGNLYASRRFPEDEKVHHGAFVSRGLNKKILGACKCFARGLVKFISALATFLCMHACLPGSFCIPFLGSSQQ